MKIRTISLLTIAVVVLAACGGAATDWKDFSSAKGNFTITMPSVPKESSQSVDTAAGKVDLTMFTSQVGTSAYLVSFSDYPEEVMNTADPLKVLDGAMNGSVTNFGGTVLTSKDITIDNNPGKEFTADGKVSAPGDGSLSGRIYLVKNRLYQVIVVGLKDKTVVSDIDKYLQSFKLNK